MGEVEIQAFVGIDWGTESHSVCALAPCGEIIWQSQVSHDADSLDQLCGFLLDLGEGNPRSVHVGLEVPHGVVVETLLDFGFTTYSINPKQADRFRDRFSPSGAKDDSLDARVIGDSLRTDGHCFRLLSLDNPKAVELREWSRISDELRTEHNRLTNRIREQLRRYFPQFLKVNDELGKDWVLDLWELVPTPDRARRVRLKTLAKFLREHRIRKTDAMTVQSVLRRPSMKVSLGTMDAACAHIRLLVERVRVVNRQLRESKKTLELLCDALTATEDEESSEGRNAEHHDVEILRSMVGIGNIVLATMLGEAWWAIKSRDYETLRALGGVAPVTKRSGKRHTVEMRRACNPRLRNVLYHWARVAVQHDPQSRHRYAKLRLKGHSHGRALRTVSDRLLSILCAMLRDGTLYDAGRRTLIAYPQAAEA